MKNYTVAIGRSTMSWQSPYDYTVPQPEPQNLGLAQTSVSKALDAPINSPSLEELASNAKNIVIIVPDATRSWQNIPQMAKAARDRIDKPLTWIIATGGHRPILEEEKQTVLGNAMRDGDSFVCHCCDDVTELQSATSGGNKITLNKHVASADLVVMIGGITYHDLAGFSGGRKSIMPGVSGRPSINHNHNYCLTPSGVNPLIGGGNLAKNPMAIDMLEYANLALQGKKAFLLNTIANSSGNPHAWVAGHYLHAWEEGVKTAINLQTLYTARPARRIITSCGGYPNDMDLYQSTKALFSTQHLLEPGGAIVLVADVEDSLGPGIFGEALKVALHDPYKVLDQMRAAFTIPGFIAAKTVIDLSTVCAAIVSSREDIIFPGKIFRDMQSADNWLREVSGLEGHSVLVPSANATFLKVKI